MKNVTIEVDHETFEFLQKRAKPFVDSPNSVLRRLLLSGFPDRGPDEQGDYSAGDADADSMPVAGKASHTVAAVPTERPSAPRPVCLRVEGLYKKTRGSFQKIDGEVDARWPGRSSINSG